jgi:hypothetical protein
MRGLLRTVTGGALIGFFEEIDRPLGVLLLLWNADVYESTRTILFVSNLRAKYSDSSQQQVRHHPFIRRQRRLSTFPKRDNQCHYV